MESIKVQIDTSDCPYAGVGKVVTIVPVDPNHPFPSLVSPRDVVRDSDTLKNENSVTPPNKPSQTCLFGNWLLND